MLSSGSTPRFLLQVSLQVHRGGMVGTNFLSFFFLSLSIAALSLRTSEQPAGENI